MHIPVSSPTPRAVWLPALIFSLFSGLANAAPPPKALMQSSARAPDLQERLPVQALAHSQVVGQLSPGLLTAGSIAVSLDDGRTVVAQRRRDVTGPLGSKTWVGEFDDSVGSILVLTQHRGVISGFLHHDDAIYELMPSRSRAGQHVLFRLNDASLPPMSPSPAIETGDGDAVDAAADLGTTDATATGTVVDLMVVYTPAARSKYGQANLESRILSAVSAANQGYLNSRVDLSLNLVRSTEVSYQESGDMSKSLVALQSASDGQMDIVHSWRNETGADLVMLISEDTNYCGYANTMRSVSTAFAGYAFSISNADCLTNHTLTHELGHNMGGQHNREDGSSGGAYPYSYGFRNCGSVGTKYRTIMAYHCTGANRINYFSNPYLSFDGQALGIAYETSSSNAAENARTLNNTKSTVAAFRSAAATAPAPTPTAPAAPGNATTHSASDQRIDLSWADQSDNESGFRIERSPNGVNWSEIAQVGSNVRSYADNGLSAATWYYYRVRAWNSVGNSNYSNVASALTQAQAPLPPAAPGSIAAGATGTEVNVVWVDLAANEAGFEVRRETYNSRKRSWGSAVIMKVAAPDITSLADSPGSGTFRYHVRSYNAGGFSAWVGPASATVESGQGSGSTKRKGKNPGG